MGMTTIAMAQWVDGCAHVLPKVGRRMRRMGVSAQCMAQRTEAMIPMRSTRA